MLIANVDWLLKLAGVCRASFVARDSGLLCLARYAKPRICSVQGESATQRSGLLELVELRVHHDEDFLHEVIHGSDLDTESARVRTVDGFATSAETSRAQSSEPDEVLSRRSALTKAGPRATRAAVFELSARFLGIAQG